MSKYLELLDEGIFKVKDPKNLVNGIEVVNNTIAKVRGDHTFHVVVSGRQLSLVEYLEKGNGYILTLSKGPMGTLNGLFSSDPYKHVVEPFRVVEGKIAIERPSKVFQNNISLEHMGDTLPDKLDGKRFVIGELLVYTLMNMSRD